MKNQSLKSYIKYPKKYFCASKNSMSTNKEKVLALIESGVKGLIFDLDGTVADSMPLHIKAWKKMGDYYGATITDDMINHYAGSPTNKVIMSLNHDYGFTMDPVEGSKMKSRLFVEMLDEVAHIDPISEVLDIAKKYQGNIPLAIGTGSSRVNALKTIAYMGCEGMFDVVVSATDVQNHKPHPESFLKAAELMGVDSKDCIVFEDGCMGIKAALDGGMIAIEIPSFEIIRPEVDAD
jgi:beta-phosphoglucomutase family hydrolase